MLNMNLEKLKKMLEKKEARKKQLLERSDASNDLTEMRSINADLDTLNEEIAELRSLIDAIPDEVPAGGNTPPLEGRSAVGAAGSGTAGLAQVLSSFGLQQNQRSEDDDKYATVEYRKAFMEYARSGQVSGPLVLEKRADATTTTQDAAAVIPTTILNEVIRKMTSYGQVYSRVRKMNVQGGVQVPISSLIPVATWIGERNVSDRQKLSLKDSVTFTYFGLECRISQTLLSNVTSLEIFEQTIAEVMFEAMIKAIDQAVISGTGVGQPLGILNDTRVPATQIVTINETEILEYQEWKKKIFAKMPLRYKAGAAFFMASSTFETYIDGMVDKNGQPVGRVNLNITNGVQERFGGKEVIQVEDDIIAPFDTAAEDDIVAIYVNLKNYAINTNMQLMLVRYTDHETNEIIDKAILIADGKLLDPNGVIIVKKGATV